MDEDYKEGVVSILRGREGWYEQYSSISEFKHHLNQASPLADEKSRYGWVLRNEYDSNNTKIITLLKHMASHSWFLHGNHCLVQFWAVVKVEGRHHYLSTSHQPFCVGRLSKGVSWYRNLSSQYQYDVDMEGAEAEKEQLGGVGRAYRNRRPESTPDLRLYSIKEFPLRDQAARYGFRRYLALPLFDLHQNQCYGVLELLSYNSPMDTIFSVLHEGLKMAELRSTHVDFIPIIRDGTMPDKYKKPPAESEIREILEVAIKVVPRLSLAQVWVPCKQCANMSTNLFCMERASFIHHRNKMINICTGTDNHMLSYLEACEFQNLQIDLNCLHPNLCDLTISKNPLAHYAVKARLSHCFTIFLQSVTKSNDLYVIQFFLRPKCREDACGDSSLHLLLRIIEMKLRSFIFVSREQLPEELVVQSRQPNAIEWEFVDQLDVMNSFEETISESNFTAYLETGDSCCLRPSFGVSLKGLRRVFCGPTEEKLVENDVKSYSLLLPVSMKEKIEDFMKKISVRIRRDYWIVQFWVPKMAEDRCYLETSDQPYAVSCLAKGLASFRKECIKHHYFVDEETKEEELGPPGRVFRNGHPEITPDLFLYSTKEFSMRNYAVHCGLQEYFALPVFEKLEHKCVGVLEFVGFYIYALKDVGIALKEAKLHSIHSNFQPNFMAEQKPDNIINCMEEAMVEVEDAFSLINNIPHLHMAKVWVPYDECARINGISKCMKLALSTEFFWDFKPTYEVHVQPKNGIIGMVLESEKFFLNPSPQYLQSFFSFLLPIMKHRLKSFKMASGKQLGEEFVVEVIKFSEANQLKPSESDVPDIFPIKFKSVQYGQKEHPFTTEQQEQSVPYATETEQCNVNASNLTTIKRGKRKTGLHLSLDDLKPHFGKKLNDVAGELGVGRSTIKRVKDVALTMGSTSASLPGPLKVLRFYAENKLNDGSGILIVLDNDVFGNECKIYVHREDIIPFCDLEPISGNCIVVYIWHLYNKTKKENTIRRFQFVNPFAISHVPNSQPFTRAHALANRLIAASPNQLVLVPCNIGEHWILTVIEPYKEVVSLLDPLNRCNCDESWEVEVNVAMSMFNTNLKKDMIERPTWKIIKVPRQPDHKQCGFYVMRYMKEIIQGLNTIDSSSLSSLFVKEEYSQTDINEVRIEWANCVQEHA
ncbi:hypothetical protein C2S51_027957 [Perilla frutescens var. frutescens]|nr:hypothetical protein C2S51_027957 [Perilla frutescens var. frutescens]